MFNGKRKISLSVIFHNKRYLFLKKCWNAITEKDGQNKRTGHEIVRCKRQRERARKKYDAIPEMARDYIDAFDDERNSHNA